MTTPYILPFVLTLPLVGMPARPADTLRDAYADAVQRSALKERPDFDAVVPELVMLYHELDRTEGMSHTERNRLRSGLKTRMEQISDRLEREKLRSQREGRRRVSPRTSQETRLANATAPGGTAARAQQLIDLITTTIEPDSWEVNGGRGRIMFYAPLNVLVIRQTGEVHHQIGSTLGTLRK
jgi:hypothetical protein